MRILPISTQAFKGTLVIPRSGCQIENKNGQIVEAFSPELEINTNDIVEIDNSIPGESVIKFPNDYGEIMEHSFFVSPKTPKADKERVLLGYIAASLNNDVIVKI